MIDKDGKIGGKINLIDLIIILVILIAIVSVFTRIFAKEEIDIIVGEPVVLEFTSTEVNDYTVERLKLGDPVIDGSTENEFGMVVDIKIDDAYTYTVTDSGQVVDVKTPGCKSVVLTMEATGTLDDNGIIIKNYRYGVGHSTTIFVGECKLWGKISGIDPA